MTSITQPTQLANKQRFDWVDLSKGICIFAVVLLYSVEAMRKEFGDAGWLMEVVEFARPFRMPDFFLISGLFLARVIDRPWLQYLDKKVVHYIYFFALWTLINVAIMRAIGDIGGGVPTFIRALWSNLSSWPFHMLWFIQMLPAYFLFTRLTRRAPKLLMFVIAALLQAFPLLHTERTIIDEFWNRYVYFYAGYAFASLFFALADQVKAHPRVALAGLLVWGVINGTLVNMGYSKLPFVSLALGFAGAGAVITTAALIAHMRQVQWLRYMGEHSIVVYLAFYWPMILCQAILLALGWPSDLGLFGTLITVAGIVGAFMLYWGTQRMKIGQWLFERPRWAAIPDILVQRFART